ncbi:MAG: TrkH family potassium uptake protein [Gammaproteobacteria bacterium]
MPVTFLAIQRVLGYLVMLFSLTMLTPIVVSILFEDGTWSAFGASFLIILGSGTLIWYPVRNEERELRLRDGFLVVALFWVVLGLFGSAPLLMSVDPSMAFTDAVFESVSGLTTTGATVLTGLDDLPQAILFYRQQLQWLGGLGIIVLAVAVLPMLGVGGMQLYRAETPGPVKDSRLTPRITETAKALWYVYLGITIVCGLAYWAAGMELFDALCHAFSTVAIGGFSTHDASIGYFQSPLIEMITVVFMFIAGVNFSLHFLAWKRLKLSNYIADPEFIAYVKLLGGLTLFVLVYLYLTGHYSTLSETFTKGLFHVISVGTTTGFTTDNFVAWPGALPVLLILSSFVGGCAGSTAGGMKVIRWLLMYKQGWREVQRLVHPSAAITVKLGDKAVHNRVVDSVWGFFAVYVVVFGILMLVLLAVGVDQITAFSAIAAMLNNLGPGLGEVANNYGSVDPVSKWAMVCAMLLGRLEIFTLLVLITPTFWRR